MHIVMLGFIELHDRCLAPIGEPAVSCTILPAIQAGFMNPLIILTPQHKGVLFPHKALPDFQPDIVASPPKVVSFGVGVEDVK